MPLPTLLRKGFLNISALPAEDRQAAESLLAVDYIVNRVSAMVKRPPKSAEDRVLVIKASTGSGKSTALIQHLFLRFRDTIKKNIAVTQPRVITAVDTAMKLPEYSPEIILDVNIGYTTGSFKRLPKEKGIIYMTVDSLRDQFVHRGVKSVAEKYGFIIIDEVHERNTATDNCLFRIKTMLRELMDSPSCPIVILMSATFDERIFLRYFGLTKKNYIEVEGQTFEKTRVWPEYSMINYQDYLLNQAVKIHITQTEDYSSRFRDILIFLSGGAEIADMVKRLHEINTLIYQNKLNLQDIDRNIKSSYLVGGGNHYMYPISLTRSSYLEGGGTYHSIFSRVSSLRLPIYVDGKVKTHVVPSRKVFVATNIAETGITLKTLKYCLDSGYYTSMEFNPVFGCSMILTKPITFGMSVQRMGRVGREAPGTWYPAYTKKTQDAMQKEQFSEITFSDITSNMLTILISEQDVVEQISERETDYTYRKYRLQNHQSLVLHHGKKFSLKSLDLIETPSAEMLSYAMEKLNVLGLIDRGMRITVMGYYADRMRFIPVESARMIMSGYIHGVSIKWLTTIAAILYTKPTGLYSKPNYVNYLSHAAFETIHNVVIADDFILQLCTFEYIMDLLSSSLKKSYMKNKPPTFDLESWCSQNDVDYAVLINASQFRDELIYNLIDNGLNPYAFDDGPLIGVFGRSFEEGIAEVAKIKTCIYEGFRMNLAVWTPEISSYVINRRGVPVVVGSSYVQKNIEGQSQPNYIVLSSYALQSTRKNELKIQAKSMISVLDGHVQPDLSF